MSISYWYVVNAVDNIGQVLEAWSFERETEPPVVFSSPGAWIIVTAPRATYASLVLFARFSNSTGAR